MSAKDDINVVRTFWHGSDLSAYEELALSSFVKLGHTVQIFSYHQLRAIDGVERVDAASVLPESEVFSYQKGSGKGSFAAFANLFRYKLLYELGGTWVDTDVLCLKHLSALPSACVGWQDDSQVNNAIMRFPAGHHVTKNLYERARELGRNVQWGQAGPRLLTEIVLQNRDQVEIMPREIFYPIHWRGAWKIVSAKEYEHCEASAAESYCFHWWNEVLRRIGIPKDTLPPVGSYLYRRACEILGDHGLEALPENEVEARIASYLASSPPGHEARAAQLRSPSRASRRAGREPVGGWIKRLKGNPIIRPVMLPANDGNNINGPSLIRVPAWIKNPLAKYYLYFAHHKGKYIRLAYANHLNGPWKIYEPGTLRLEDTANDCLGNPVWARHRHVASPDVHVNDESLEIRMYFHGAVYMGGPPENWDSYQQLSLVATSKDGLHFAVRPERLGNSYFRVFEWNGTYYALGMPGVFYRSADGLQGFVEGPTLFTVNMRHAAVEVNGNILRVFYSVVGENPERILLSTIDLSRPWSEWKASKPIVVLEPKMGWEGAALPARPSVRGPARGPVRELRDPAIFVEAGRTYLLYSVAGESGIAIAEIHEESDGG